MIKVDKLNPFGRMCISLGMLPSSYKESLTYEEQLLWFFKYLDETVIPTVNNNADAVEELQALYIQIKSYVDEYFDNLDVQEEINNKLDDMAESGELTDIIAQYLGLAGVLAYNTVADMKAAENLTEGSICKTLGYHTINDGGTASYKIRTITNEDIVDEATIIALNDNSLIAELIKDTINVNQFGAYGDGIHDDTQAIQKAFNYASEYNEVVFNPFSTYLISSAINISKDININGNYCKILLSDSFNDYAFRYNVDLSGNAISIYPKINATIQNLVFVGNPDNFTNNNGILICQQVEIKNIRFQDMNKCIYFTNDYIDRAEVHNIYCNNRTGEDYAIYMGNQGDAKYFHHLQYGGPGMNMNLLQTGNNLVHCNIENIVSGTIDVKANATLRNIMLSYYSNIYITGCDCTLENVQYTKNKINERRIIVNSDGRKLPNIEFKNIKGFFVNAPVEYNDTPINSILINNCNSYKFTNVLTGVRYGNNYKQTAIAFDKIDFGSDVKNTLYNKYTTSLNDKLIYSKNYDTIFITEPILTGKTVNNNLAGYFKGEPATYYYQWAQGIDVDNGFAKTLSSEFSIEIPDTEHYGRVELTSSNSTQMPDKMRIYRGTTSGTYTEYADLCYCNDILIDNGISINGVLWRSMSDDGISYRNMDNNNVVKNIELVAVGSNTYVTKYNARNNPIAHASWFANGTYAKGTLLYDYNNGLAIYIYDGTTWNKVTN